MVHKEDMLTVTLTCLAWVTNLLMLISNIKKAEEKADVAMASLFSSYKFNSEGQS